MSVFYKLVKNNTKNSKSFGKWYARIVSMGTVSFHDLCRHISEHNSVFGEDVCLGVATKLQACIVEQLLEGKRVQFGDLGTFYLSSRSEGSESIADFSASKQVANIYLRFTPSRTRVSNFASAALRKRCQLVDVNTLAAEEAIEAKKKEALTAAEDGE